MFRPLAPAESLDLADQSPLGDFITPSRFGAIEPRYAPAGRNGVAQAVRRTREAASGAVRRLKWSLALGAAAVAFAAIASAASAAECVGGYRTLSNDVILQCGVSTAPASLGYVVGPDAPAITGSIGAPVPRAAPRSPAVKATNPQDCQPGGYWYMQTEEGPWSEVPMACR